MAAVKIPAFPYEQADYDYAGDALKKSWERLHRGDREPYPADAKLQAAWRAFHRGDYSKAIAEGAKLKAPGATVASKSAAVAATYLVDDDKAAIRLLLEAAERADAATRASPGDANAWYMQAFVLGRYAQSVSVVKALAAGIGSKVRKALDRAIALEPKHADAHIALGLYHAEIIDKVGALAGRLTYGADAAAAVKHFEQALKLNPGSAIAHMEYANGLLMLHGEKKQKQAVELYRRAAACKPADAMERLDVEQAKAELE
jgi:tetratricopeptide (TPR) repeat protein